jgi:hypothetical protein
MTTASVPYPGYPGDPYHAFRTLIDIRKGPGPQMSIESPNVISCYEDFLKEMATQANSWIEDAEDLEYVVFPEAALLADFWEIDVAEIEKLKSVTGSWEVNFGNGDCFCPDWPGLGHPELYEEAGKGVTIAGDCIVIGVIQEYCYAKTLTFIVFTKVK